MLLLEITVPHCTTRRRRTSQKKKEEEEEEEEEEHLCFKMFQLPRTLIKSRDSHFLSVKWTTLKQFVVVFI